MSSSEILMLVSYIDSEGWLSKFISPEANHVAVDVFDIILVPRIALEIQSNRRLILFDNVFADFTPDEFTVVRS